MRTPEEIQGRIEQIKNSIPKTKPSQRNKLRSELYALEWILGNKLTAEQRLPAKSGYQPRPPKIIKNHLNKQAA